MEQWNITITGKVQGVFYRASAKQKAENLGVQGKAENRSDGSVQIEAVGPPDKLKEFVQWCWQGSESANVDEVQVEKRSDVKDFETFYTR